MRITILCSSKKHPINDWLQSWIKEKGAGHSIELIREKEHLRGGDLLFLISCSQIIGKAEREKYRSTLVIHASDLPQGRGWSPHIWQIVEGKADITVSLLEADDAVDTGRIWKKLQVPIKSHWLYDEINNALFHAELQLMSFAVENFESISPYPQPQQVEPSYYRKRTPEDSRIDPSVSIADQFDKIRVSDPNRFPAFFECRGQRYKLIVERFS